MTRQTGSVNKNTYHFEVTDYNHTDGGEKNFYKTMYDIAEKYNCSRRLIIYNHSKNDNKINKKGKLKGLLIKKINQTI